MPQKGFLWASIGKYGDGWDRDKHRCTLLHQVTDRSGLKKQAEVRPGVASPSSVEQCAVDVSHKGADIPSLGSVLRIGE